MTESHRLGDLQLAIMRVLWDRDEASVADVHAALEPHRGLALTTIATMLSKMEKKGIVAHRQDGRQYIYHPTIEEHDVHRSMVRDLVDRLFLGDASALVNHLVHEGQIDRSELDQIRALVDLRSKSDHRGKKGAGDER